MMTQKCYYDDSLMTEFSAQVVSSVGENGRYNTVLDRTCFFPTEGGQNHDTGTIENAAVLDVIEKNGEIIHITDIPLQAGKTVRAKVDFRPRFCKMQCHTGEHIISGTVHNLFGFENRGFHLGDGPYFTCDFSGELSPRDIKKIEKEVNEIIAQNRAVTAKIYQNAADIGFDFRAKNEFENNIRIVTIEGCDKCACCAPHLPRTGQVGVAKIISAEKYKGGTRITAVCGLNAYDDYCITAEQNERISRLLSAKREKTAAAVERLMGERDALKHELYFYKNEYAENAVKSAVKQGENTVFLGTKADNDMLCAALNVFEKSGAVFAGEGESFTFAAKGSEDNMKMLCKAVKEELNGKGGGKGEFVRGSINAAGERIAEVFKRYL